MKNQKEIWLKEHLDEGTFTRIHSKEPSGPILELVEFLKKQNIIPKDTYILDLGCGKGRNSIYLASKGFRVLGTDFIPEAVEHARKRAKTYKNLEFRVLDLTKNWSFDDATFDVVVDCNTTICIENPGRQKAISEIYRVLKPSGYYLFYGVAPSELIDKFPGHEPNSAIFPRSGKFEKQYTREELLDAYKNFKLIRLKTKAGSDIIEGEETEYSMWIGLFQK